MTESVRLSKAEMADLCGSPQRVHQKGFLRINGIPYYVDRYGWPVVLRSQLDPGASKAQHGQPAWKPHKVA